MRSLATLRNFRILGAAFIVIALINAGAGYHLGDGLNWSVAGGSLVIGVEYLIASLSKGWTA